MTITPANPNPGDPALVLRVTSAADVPSSTAARWLVRKVDPLPSGAWHEVAARHGVTLLARCGRTFDLTRSHSSSTPDADDVCHVCAAGTA